MIWYLVRRWSTMLNNHLVQDVTRYDPHGNLCVRRAEVDRVILHGFHRDGQFPGFETLRIIIPAFTVQSNFSANGFKLIFYQQQIKLWVSKKCVVRSINCSSMPKKWRNTQLQKLELLYPWKNIPLHTFCFQHEIFLKNVFLCICESLCVMCNTHV